MLPFIAYNVLELAFNIVIWLGMLGVAYWFYSAVCRGNEKRTFTPTNQTESKN